MKIKALSIAGFDGSGGAGLQADLKTLSALGVYGMSVLTALPVQNTQGVRKVWRLPSECIEDQLEAIFDDLDVHVVKIGMLFDAKIIKATASFLRARAQNVPIVLDPVMAAKNGGLLLLPEAVDALIEELLPLATVCTPNIPEAEVILQQKIPNKPMMENAAKELKKLGCQSVLLKGGHFESDSLASDVFVDDSIMRWLNSERIMTRNNHGTGCTLSAAIAANLAKGCTALNACINAKKYLTRAMVGAKDVQIGKGHGPVHHFCDWW